ncbi:MAG: hypothetical protein K2G49_02180 [Muribaculum sp.]|nr:hypothetical protein [Muribaculum sp.]
MIERVNIYCLGLLCAVMLAALPSCGARTYEEPCGSPEPGYVTMAIDALTLDAVAGDDAGELPDAEKINNLRVIILSRNIEGSEWTVEHNDYIAYDGAVMHDRKEYKVAPNAFKRVYLIANCRSAVAADGSVLDMSQPAAYLPVSGGSAPVDDAVLGFTEGEMEMLPMSALYETYVYENDVHSRCYIVRAVNKLTLTVKNRTAVSDGDEEARDIRLVDWTVSDIADRSFLMPHVGTTGSGCRVVDTDLVNTVYVSDWTEWLVDEAKKRERGDVARYQWLTDYAMPSSVTYGGKTCSYSEPPLLAGNSASEAVYTASPVYFAESRDVDNGSALGLQSYTLTLHTEERVAGADDSEAWIGREYKAELPQLVSLFRNTHVVVDVAVGRLLDVTVEEQPYAWVELKPVFGLDRDENGEIIVRK